MNKFFITSAIPYVNAKPHIGHALEYFQADVIRRFHKIIGDETLFLSGADENAIKNVQAAEKEGVPIKEFLNRNSEIFRKAYEELGVHLDVFQRGSDQKKHWPGVQKLWKLCEKNGDIYKKKYKGLYCIGCESFKTEKELVKGLCSIHLKKPEKIEEENYFFRLSKYQDRLLGIIEKAELKISPENKRNEIVSFIRKGLEDFSVSRSKKRARGVGVPVPGDPEQIIYVWFDALAIYITGIGFGWDEKNFKKWWPADLHVIGKDINRFHTVYWPAMLLSAKLPLPHEVLVHSFINIEGAKMSKTLGNIIDPFEIIKKYGLEPFRYYLLSQIPIDSDSDFSEERFKKVYNADLANGLGNLVARSAKLLESANFSQPERRNTSHLISNDDYKKALSEFRFNDALSFVWSRISDLDKYINSEKPWEKLKTQDHKLKAVLSHIVDGIEEIGILLEPFLPSTSKKIAGQFNKSKIKLQKPLFPRLA